MEASRIVEGALDPVCPSRSPVEVAVGDTVDRLVRIMEDLVHRVPGGDRVSFSWSVPNGASPPSRPDGEIALRNAKLILAVRRLRESVLGVDFFSDPAWFVLLELYVAAVEGAEMSVGNACIAAGVPLTSALRLCQQLQDCGHVTRDRDPRDRRRVLLSIGRATFDSLTTILAGAKPRSSTAACGRLTAALDG